MAVAATSSSYQRNNVQMMPTLSTNLTNGEGTSRTLAPVPSSINHHLKGITNEHNATQQTQSRFKTVFGNSPSERMHFFTGTVDRVIKWNRTFKQPCYFEVIASVVSLRDGTVNLQKVILLRDKKGPILQVLYYINYDMELQNFKIGDSLRCVGYMTGTNTLTAVNIRTATPEEVASLKRYCYIGDFTISGLINAEEGQSNN